MKKLVWTQYAIEDGRAPRPPELYVDAGCKLELYVLSPGSKSSVGRRDEASRLRCHRDKLREALEELADEYQYHLGHGEPWDRARIALEEIDADS